METAFPKAGAVCYLRMRLRIATDLKGQNTLRERSTVVSLRLLSIRLLRIRVSCAKRSFISCKWLKPQDHVAVYGLTTELLVLHDFTRDSSDLVAAANKFSPKELAAFDATHTPDIDLASLGADLTALGQAAELVEQC